MNKATKLTFLFVVVLVAFNLISIDNTNAASGTSYGTSSSVMETHSGSGMTTPAATAVDSNTEKTVNKEVTYKSRNGGSATLTYTSYTDGTWQITHTDATGEETVTEFAANQNGGIDPAQWVYASGTNSGTETSSVNSTTFTNTGTDRPSSAITTATASQGKAFIASTAMTAGGGLSTTSNGVSAAIGTMSADDWKAWKDWQASDEGNKNASYSEYKGYQNYKDTLSFDEYQQYRKDAGLDKLMFASSGGNKVDIGSIDLSPYAKMSAEDWKAWKDWQASDEGNKNASYGEYKGYQNYKDTLSFDEYQQYRKDAGLDKLMFASSGGSKVDIGNIDLSKYAKMSAEDWKSWKTWLTDNKKTDVTYADYKRYQSYKDKLTYDEYKQYLKDSGLDKLTYGWRSFYDYEASLLK